MTDYVPKYVDEMSVRNFFSPALDYDAIGKAELLMKIESVEDFVEAAYFNDTSVSADLVRIPCLLLIASKIISIPSLATRYGTLSKELLGDYSYELAISSRTSDTASPHSIAITWEKMALRMLEERSRLSGKGYTWGLWKSNS